MHDVGELKTRKFAGYCSKCGLMLVEDDNNKCPRCSNKDKPTKDRLNKVNTGE